ncbi:MAG: glycosyltransferase family 39 protein [Candidatus Omnitrophica bacterium]|nr:glycosyltransferase family 39 protein [Candidatus Omnitrophota bacterium]
MSFASMRLWAVLLLAFGLRLCGANFGLPGLFHQDEPIVVNHALAYVNGDLNPHFFKIPPLLSYLLFGVYGVYYAVMAVFCGMTRENFALLFFRDPGSFYFLGRLIFGVVMGTASVYLLYRLTRKLFDENTAVLAAGFFAVSYLHVRDSHYLYADIPMIFTMLLAMNSLASYVRCHRQRDLILASVWAGVSVAFKYIAAPILVPIFVVLAGEAREAGKTKFLKKSLSVLAACAAAYLLLNPYSVLDFSFFVKELRQQAAVESGGPFFHHLRYSLAEGAGAGAFVLGSAGLFFLFWSSPRSRWFFSFPVVYYLLIGFFSQPYERYAMPVVPFLCLAAAVLLEILKQKTRAFPGKNLIFFMLILATVWPSLKKDLYLNQLLIKPDTRAQAAEWFLGRVPEGVGIILDHPFFSPRFFQTADQLHKKINRITDGDPHAGAKVYKIQLMLKAREGKRSYRIFYLNPERLKDSPFLLWSPLVDPDLSSVRESGAQYYVRYRYPGEPDFFDRVLRPHAERVEVFSPYRSEAKVWTEDPWANVALPFLSRELFSRKSAGPYLEIYKILPA